MITAASPSERPFVILCIEDEAQLRHDIRDELIEAGYQVVEAGDGSEALAILENQRPDLVLCDISMPGLDGYGVLDALRRNEQEHAEIPFLFLSALGDPRHIVDGKRLGADDYLVKPIDYDLLLATIEARLRQIGRIRSARRPHSPQPACDAATLARSYGLTPAEIRISRALTEGRNLTQIATDLGVSRSTVAFHMRNIFQKTGTGRQAELVALLLRQ